VRLLFTATDTGWQQIGSRLIRAFEGGLASHCGAVLSDGLAIDTTLANGVAVQPVEAFLKGRTLVADLNVPVPDEAAAEAWAVAQIGRPYDWRDIASFLLWRDVGKANIHVCSGFPLRALMTGGLQLGERPDRFGVRHLLILASAKAA